MENDERSGQPDGGRTPGPVDPETVGAAPRRRNRRVTRRGTEREAVPGLSADERPAGWSETDASDDTNDARLTRDVPPHW